MATYRVFEHPVLGKKAVKNGFSAGGCLLSGVWMLYHKMWFHAVVLFVWSASTAYIGADQGLKAMMSAQLFLYHLPVGLLYGFKGNRWLASHLRKLGYKDIKDVEALSPEDALAKVATPSQQGALIDEEYEAAKARLFPKSGVPFQQGTDSSSPSSTGLAEQLAKLNELRQQGALSDEEYQAAKAKLLR